MVTIYATDRMSYQVSEHRDAAHRSSMQTGARLSFVIALFIVDYYSYCVIEMDERQGFCAVHYSTDIVPGWLRGRRSGVGASSRSSLRYVVRGGRVAPRGLQFWEMPDVAH